jgi:hypothetical protein
MRQNHFGQFVLEQSGRVIDAAIAEASPKAENSERETKVVITGWVREHEHRSEEYRRAFKDLLSEEGFISIPTITRDEDEGK